MTLRAKLVQPRSIKTTRKLCTIGVNSTAELKTDDNFKKTKSTSVHAHNNSKSSTTTKLPSLYSNNLKYFLKESTVKKMKKRDYNYNRQDPSYIM